MKEKNKNPKGWITIRVKPEEYNTIYNFYEETACRKLSEYARKTLLQKPVTVTYRNQSADEILAALNKLKNELSAVGNNFNQFVKKLHTLNSVSEIKSWVETHEILKQNLFQKIEETRVQMNQLYELWCRK